MNYQSFLDEANATCRVNQKEESAVKQLLLAVTKLDSATLLAKFNEEIPEALLTELNEKLHKYVYENIPVQYLTSEEYFYGRAFHVDERVLIPRYETEELVSRVLDLYDERFINQTIDVVDVGTGSGAIAVSLTLEEPHMKMSATDLSEDALIVAKLNAETLGANVTFYQGDMLAPLSGKFDLIVSNPPYIPISEIVDPLVLENEPHMALFGGEEGLDFYNIIIRDSKRFLKHPGAICFEHAYDKKEHIKALALQYYPNAEIRQYKDMQGKDRMTFILVD